MIAVGKVKLIRQSCFVMGIRGSVGDLLGNKTILQGRERAGVLTGRDVSSLVVGRLCDQAGRQGTVITCFCFDFAAGKEQSATSMLSSLLKQVVSGMERISEQISRAFQEHTKDIGGRAL